MNLRRLTVAVLAAAIPILTIAGPASAATYPPGIPAEQKTVAPGVVYGGSSTGAQLLDTCSGSKTATVAEGAAFVIRVCGWLPGSNVVFTLTTPDDATKTVGTLVADGDGSV